MIKTLLVLALITGLDNASCAQEEIMRAFAKGSAEDLAPHLAAKVDIEILDKEKALTAAQTVAQLKAFFSGHEITAFRQVHSGASKGAESNYMIGELSTDRGAYRVYLYFDAKETSRLISEIRIQRLSR